MAFMTGKVVPRNDPDYGATALGLAPGIPLAPLWAEWWYFAQVFYAVLGNVLNLSFGSIGVALLAVLAGTNVLRLGRRMGVALIPLALPLAFVATYMSVQLLFFHESPLNEGLRPLVSWVLGMTAVQCLALRRGFLHRAAFGISLVGACTLPFMTLYRGGDRIGLEKGIGIANPNDLSAWFGFCAVYFAVIAFETRRMTIRVAAGAALFGCVLVMMLTVSRGPLFALAVALLIALRRVLRRGFFALLPLVIIAWTVYALGFFDQSANLLAARGMEDSGRFLVWPLALARFVNSPLIGVGVSKVATFVAEKGIDVTPHNQFIYIALASGIVPLGIFIMYWVKLARAALLMERHGVEDAALAVPLLLYVFMIGLQLNEPYVASWAVIVFGAVSANGFVLQAREAVAGRLGVPGPCAGRGTALVWARHVR